MNVPLFTEHLSKTLLLAVNQVLAKWKIWFAQTMLDDRKVNRTWIHECANYFLLWKLMFGKWRVYFLLNICGGHLRISLLFWSHTTRGIGFRNIISLPEFAACPPEWDSPPFPQLGTMGTISQKAQASCSVLFTMNSVYFSPSFSFWLFKSFFSVNCNPALL